jgi:hypothetical protein
MITDENRNGVVVALGFTLLGSWLGDAAILAPWFAILCAQLMKEGSMYGGIVVLPINFYMAWLCFERASFMCYIAGTFSLTCAVVELISCMDVFGKYWTRRK